MQQYTGVAGANEIVPVMRATLLVTTALLACLSCTAETHLQILDQSKAPLPKILVIVKYLEDGS